MALATTEQLRQVFDEDLWASAGPGLDPTLDPQRFALWLEVMLEAGEAATAAQLAELPEELPACVAVERLAAASPRDRRALAALEHAARQAAATGRPWTLRARLTPLGLPMGTHRSLAALLEECPSSDGAPLSSLRDVERASALLEAL